MGSLTIYELPAELIIHILNALDYQTLLHTRQACRLFNKLYQNAAGLQYKVELAVANMENGPPSGLGAADRLQRLKQHQEAWATLTPNAQQIVPMLKGSVWELYGGVLSQARGSSTLAFKQLPSVVRGIEDKEWTVSGLGFDIRDYGMDPSQQLLAIIQKPARSNVNNEMIQIHLRSLFTGASHPAAHDPAVLTHTPEGIRHSFTIQISSVFLGILFESRDELYHELVIWNWQTGAIEMWMSGTEIASFQFLSDRHVLVGYVMPLLNVNQLGAPPREPRLVVVDFLVAAPEKVEAKRADFVCSFHFPILAQWAIPLAVSIRSDPAPSWTPHRDLQVPFYTSRDERLFVVTFWAADGGNVRTILLFTLTSSLFAHIETLQPGEKKRRFAWGDWGPMGSRMMMAPTGHSDTWVCYVHGTKFVSPRRWGMQKGIQVYDFNVLPYKRRLAELNTDSDAEVEKYSWISDPSALGDLVLIFQEPVSTGLPYRVQVMYPPADDNGNDYEAVMLSEDTLITLASQNRERTYRLMTF